ncbi:serine/threonine-protein kinase [Streptomyces spectabilis]|uniref:non-specific serine/threonine protein kinase n=1 Tax=Streptomyces spectabilis TaxID=68270 RepID=A0A516RC45_STRST|nr:serine/threonine-protein kinase [Streptomyces spectabilis]QDQ13229.1 serine/threonine protein kinase [Streptomyces spectabilis]
MSTEGGRVIGGRYRLVERIGSGGMGTVWRAVDALVDREVAVKEPRLPGDPHGEERRRAYARLRREARAAARVEHPAAVAVHDVVVEDDELPWIVMELIRGESLHEVLRRGALSPAESARIGLALVGALAAAHAKGIVHRDVKPANVLLGPHGRVVLTDFGIARIQGEESLTASGEFVGSLEFVAPERMSGPGAGPASDLWSLGALLYTAVEGRSPFRRTSLESTLAAVLAARPPKPECAGELGPLIEALLHRDPHERPTAAEVATALGEVARSSVGAARAETVPHRQDPARPVPGDEARSADERGSGEGGSGEGGAGGEAPGSGETGPAGPAAAPRRRTPALLAAALVGALLVGGGVWLGTSLTDGDGGGESYEDAEPISDAGEEVGEEGVFPPAEPAPKEPGPSSSGTRWTAHKERELSAEVSVPASYTEVVRDPANPIVEYSEPGGRVFLRLTKPAKAPAENALAWADQERQEYEGPPYDKVTTSMSPTSFHDQGAALLDATYKEGEGKAGSAVTREMRLMIVTDAGKAYELMVRMPKGVATYEKRGTALFKAARDRLKVDTGATGSG